MEHVIRLVIILGLVLSSAPIWACSYPGDADFKSPDGAIATKEEMIDAQTQVKTYVASIEEYLRCLEQKLAAVDETTEEQRTIYSLRYNAAVQSMESVADQFNASLREYKEAN